MSLPVVAFPDVEQVVCTYLRDHLPDARIAVALPTDVQDDPAVIIVSRVGGSVTLPFVLEQPVIDLEVYGATKAAAHDLAQQARAYLFIAPEEPTPGARIYRVSDISGLVWLPDPVDYLPRYTMTFTLMVRPA